MKKLVFEAMILALVAIGSISTIGCKKEDGVVTPVTLDETNQQLVDALFSVSNLDLTDGLLSVTASFDHQLNAVLMGCNDIRSFDINKIAKYFKKDVDN